MSQYGRSTSRRYGAEKSLPDGIDSIRYILENQRGHRGRSASVIGLVKDFRAPIATRGSVDKSIEDEYESGIKFNVFRPEDEQPQVGVGDVVLVTNAKVDDWGGNTCLCTEPGKSTEIIIFPADEIPRPPTSAIHAAKPTRKLHRGKPSRAPTDAECDYVSWIYHSSNKSTLPTVSEFQQSTERSLNIRDKSSLLKNVEEGKFYDFVVQVIKEPYDQMDRTTIWITDYTEHNNFYNFAWDGSDMPGGQDGDPFGYIASRTSMESRSWPGPFGKRSMQLSCFEPHASEIRANIKAGDWVKLRNVQVKFGRNGNNMEGFLREDRNSFGGRKTVEILDVHGDEPPDELLKEAIRRKRDYEKTAKQQKKSFAAANGNKRKAEQPVDDTKLNSRQRRDARRAAKNKQLVEAETKREGLLGLNELIKSASIDEPVFPLSTIVEQVSLTTNIDGEQVQMTLPFTNARYRAHVRVVDYRPRKLHNFAVWRKATEYDMLSDGESDPDSGDDDRDTLDAFAGKKTWEWRFALQLEDAGPNAGKNGPPKRLWAVVNNPEAQYLTNMDACDLLANPEECFQLSEQLFKLWGNLQEYKEQESKAQSQSRRRLAANQAPPDSSDDENGAHQQDDASKQVAPGISNKPFACCLRQYGVEISESDPRKCNAGHGKRYQRMFGLFGTRIS
ncbi:hypothetical protein PFICI_07669 [Pestalotiopsis fici W106-1]|uniref:Protection of telomeres protein 1 n=1 Tax=Pestalotiopsis fici (strain W106-1 / CGMCC3.15140) TaxID=1229662 RepID=W3X234_PESFW|nr:uncharacterized protein PFICI_07669 [Pestalotiopsis fici W106-1]ETS80140.1 hypothetical protein PFICI_07669 [Pestalotiopsis fici W106-1]